MDIYPQKTVVAQRSFSLEKRYDNEFVNDVFKDNILLTLAYMDGRVKKASDIVWKRVDESFTDEFTLKPGETFAFHDSIDPKYKSTLIKTTNAHFTIGEGFKHDGYLAGDGVCHLASLIYWAAKDANLDAIAPTNHDFREIPEVPREYGVSIYSYPGQTASNAQQNLYVTNTSKGDVKFVFDYDGKKLNVSVITNNPLEFNI